MSELGVRSTAEEITTALDSMEWEIVPRANWTESQLSETIAWSEPTLRKCICCGAPGYEVDH